MPTNKLAADRLKKDDLNFFDLRRFYFFRRFWASTKLAYRAFICDLSALLNFPRITLLRMSGIFRTFASDYAHMRKK